MFRYDVNGLRAYAVLSVLFFHFNNNWLTGGFVGVDIFFVISGFLMTSIIFKGLKFDNFSFVKFYSSRVNRIIPPLLTVCSVLVLFSFLFFPPQINNEVLSHALSSLGFFSNILYWSQSGYFDPSSNEKWLLHTWSLSVEWQFYLIYPIILVLIKKFISFDKIKFFILGFAFISFLFSLFVSYYLPTFSYYLLPSRIWEMLAGGVVFLFPVSLSCTRKRILEKIGLFMIIISFFIIDKTFPWPGFGASIPVLGTMFVIIASQNNSFFTNNLVVNHIGRWSYSIYLVHWPIVVFYNYSSFNGFWFNSLGLFLSIFLGFLLYHFIEKGTFFNKNLNLSKSFSLSYLFSIYMVSSLFFSIGYFASTDSQAFTNNNSFLNELIVMPDRKSGYCFNDFNTNDINKKPKNDICLLNDNKNKTDIILFGDSFAGMYDPFFSQLGQDNNFSLASVSTNWCHPSLTSSFIGPKNSNSYKQCKYNREYLISNIKSFSTVIVGGNWSGILNRGYLTEVLDFIDFCIKNGVKVVIMPSPTQYDTNLERRLSLSFYSSLFAFDLDKYGTNSNHNAQLSNLMFENLAKNSQDILYIAKNSLFDPKDYFDYAGLSLPYSLDGHHISLIGSLKSYERFETDVNYTTLLTFLTDKPNLQ
jgi:peptidoglycan/LPS O-acetylase OafA/YrhL